MKGKFGAGVMTSSERLFSSTLPGFIFGNDQDVGLAEDGRLSSSLLYNLVRMLPTSPTMPASSANRCLRDEITPHKLRVLQPDVMKAFCVGKSLITFVYLPCSCAAAPLTGGDEELLPREQAPSPTIFSLASHQHFFAATRKHPGTLQQSSKNMKRSFIIIAIIIFIIITAWISIGTIVMYLRSCIATYLIPFR